MWFEDLISPELQRASIEDWARRRNRIIVYWVEDLDATGRDFKRKIMKAIKGLEAGDAREIGVWKYSRFGRNRAGNALNLARVEQAGGQLQSATEEVDARTAIGKFTRGMLMEVAAFESDRAGEQWGEAHEYRKAAGLPPVGRARFGYDRLGRVPDPERPQRTRRDLSDPAGERYEPSPVTGSVLRSMFLDCTTGKLPGTVARRVNTEGHRNTRGLLWSGRTVQDVLDSGFGAGYLRVHDPECECARPAKCRKKIFISGAHKPVITEDEWQDYRRARRRLQNMPPRARHAVWELSALIRCGHCGSAMTIVGPYRRNRIPRVRCSRWTRLKDCPIRGRALPYPALVHVVKEWLRAEEIRLNTVPGAAAVRTAASTAQSAATQLKNELAQTDRALARLIARQALDEDVPESVWADAKKSLVAERQRVESLLADQEHVASTSSKDVRPVIRSLLEEWDTIPPAQLREILARLIRYVVAWRGEPDYHPYSARVFGIWEPAWQGPGHQGVPGLGVPRFREVVPGTVINRVGALVEADGTLDGDMAVAVRPARVDDAPA
jgi:DNA invertase Pin-like site-specific DNA recombinase